MPKYFRVGKLLIDIDIDKMRPTLCVAGCDTHITLPRCQPFGLITYHGCNYFISQHCGIFFTEGCHFHTPGCMFRTPITDPCRLLGTACPVISPRVDLPIDLTDPIQIDQLKDSLREEIENLDRMGKVLAEQMQPQTIEDVEAVEKQLDLSQAQIDEARAEIKKMRTKLAGAKKPK